VNILYSTHTTPDCMPPIAVSARQIVVGPGYPTRIEDRVKTLNVAPGRYDLASVAFSIPADQRPELTLVVVDAFQDCLPENLTAAPGRKVLLAADTHHGEKPLQKMLSYARQEAFDRIALIHDPHHPARAASRTSPSPAKPASFIRAGGFSWRQSGMLACR
jgi:hypothetical protein